ncbi:hypothetical protein JHK82_037941 [Glycine max]|nr:hypothetical protein JHK82_037941 [Glycine max]KAG5131958.1 hypothetical protein JHK84_038355 [Glycine max]
MVTRTMVVIVGDGSCGDMGEVENLRAIENVQTPQLTKIIQSAIRMATNIRRATYRFLPAMDTDSFSDSTFEFHESDLYNSARANSPELAKSVRSSRFHNYSSSSAARVGAPASLPVNVPDWSKILGDEYGRNQRRNYDDDDEARSDEEDGVGRVPPHEFLARTRIASFSVHEGVGRTLKGRDLSRVRNAIWAKTGFQD